jgi:hypothetical protein
VIQLANPMADSAVRMASRQRSELQRVTASAQYSIGQFRSLPGDIDETKAMDHA